MAKRAYSNEEPTTMEEQLARRHGLVLSEAQMALMREIPLQKVSGNYRRYSDGVLRDDWGYPVNYITLNPERKRISVGCRFGKTKIHYTLWSALKAATIRYHAWKYGLSAREGKE